MKNRMNKMLNIIIVILMILIASLVGYQYGIQHAIKDAEMYIVAYDDGSDKYDTTVYIDLDGQTYTHGIYIG